MNLSLLLEMALEAMPERRVLGGARDGLSYAALDARVRAAQVKLAQTPAERTAYLGLNSPSLAVALYASARLGRAFAPLNYRLTDAELARLVARTAPAVLIADDDMAARVPAVEGVTVMTRSAFDALPDCQGEAPSVWADESDVAILLFTSGTTGEPKAATLRHSNLASYVISTVELAGSDPDEAALVSVPPYHIAGMSGLITGLYGGRRIVHLPAFTAEAWIEAVQREGVTHAMVVPTMLQRIIDELEAKDLHLQTLRHLSYGGGRMPTTVIERALRRMPHVDFVNAYGLTETSSTVSVLTPDDHRAAFHSEDPLVRRRIGSVGRPLPHLELEVRGPQGETLGAGEAGEIWVRGDQVAGEYVGRKVLRDDGWFPTNDGGWMDEEGYLFVEGRLDDVIVRGGENISPGEVEDVLRAHPAVADVAVLGLPDEQWGEKVAAVVVARQPVAEAELRNWARERLRSTKTPEVVIFRTALPYNDTGKLLRRVLKTELSAAPATA